MRTLSSTIKPLPVEVTSAFVVESAARFTGDWVAQLLDPQSAINHLLSHGNRMSCYVNLRCVLRAAMDLSFISGKWELIKLDDGAAQLLHSGLTVLHSLVESLLQGDVLLGNLQACLKHKDQFEQLYQQCMRHTIQGKLPS